MRKNTRRDTHTDTHTPTHTHKHANNIDQIHTQTQTQTQTHFPPPPFFWNKKCQPPISSLFFVCLGLAWIACFSGTALEFFVPNNSTCRAPQPNSNPYKRGKYLGRAAATSIGARNHTHKSEQIKNEKI